MRSGGVFPTVTLETLTADSAWTPSDAEDDAIDTVASARNTLTIRVWGGDWCGDCQSVLPPFAAALETAGIDPTSVIQYPVTKRDDGTKDGPAVDEYDIHSIPTIVFERDGKELARFVESSDRPAIVDLADQLLARPDTP